MLAILLWTAALTSQQQAAVDGLQTSNAAFAALLDCTNNAAPALASRSTETAEAIAAAAVDGCIEESHALKLSYEKTWLAAGLPLSGAKTLFEETRRDLIRLFAARILKARPQSRR